MKKNKGTKLRMAVTVAAALMVFSGSVYAAAKFLSPTEVATNMDYPTLARAFESKDSLLINKTVSTEDYDITLLGTVFGRDLSDFSPEAELDKTYAVLAIENANGNMPGTDTDAYGEQDFFVSPLIKGFKPWQVNIFTMNGGSVTQVIDGVMYRLIECDSVEMFANEGVYIGVSTNNGPFCNNVSFNYDEATGEITQNTVDGKSSVVFELPIDKAKADPEKVAEFIAEQDLINNDKPADGDAEIPTDGISFEADAKDIIMVAE